MQKFAFFAIPFMFVLGQWQLIEKIYFPHASILFLLILCVLTNGVSASHTLPKSFLGWTLFYLLTTILTTWITFDLEALRASTQLLLFIFSVMLPCLLLSDEKSIISFLYAMLVGATCNAITGIVQSAIWISNYGIVLTANGEWFRVIGNSLTPIDYIMQLLIGFALCELLKNVQLRYLARSFFGVCLLFSNSRSALIVLVFFIIYRFSSTSLKTAVLYASLLSLILLLGVLSDAGQLVFSRFLDVFNFDFNIKRMITFENVLLRIFTEMEYIILGHGYGKYEFFHPIDLDIYNNPHNIYLYVLFSGGILGFVSFFGLIVYLALAIQKLKRRAKDSLHIYHLAWSIEFLFIAALLIGLVETNIIGIGASWTLGLCFGCVLATNRAILHRQLITVLSNRKNY